MNYCSEYCNALQSVSILEKLYDNVMLFFFVIIRNSGFAAYLVWGPRDNKFLYKFPQSHRNSINGLQQYKFGILRCLKAYVSTTTLLIFLDSFFPKTKTNARCFLWKQNNPQVNYSPHSDLRGETVWLNIFVWCWKLDTSQSRSEMFRRFWNVVLEKDGEDHLERCCEKWGYKEQRNNMHNVFK